MKLYPQLSRGRYADQTSEMEAAKRSLYHLWWRFLRLSEDYWWVCRFGGKSKDATLCATYGRFGNVFTDTFEEWWRANGEKLFAFKVDPPKVERMDAREFHRSMGQHYEILLVPKYLTKSEIAKQVQQVMAEHEPSQLPKQFKYDLSVSDTRGIKKHVLQAVHDVWCLNQMLQRAIELGQLDRPERFTQYWIGKKLGVMKADEAVAFVNVESQAAHQLAVRVKVNRYLAKARALIANAELGNFPVVKGVEPRERWTNKQQAQMAIELSGRRWVSPEIDQTRFKKMLGL